MSVGDEIVDAFASEAPPGARGRMSEPIRVLIVDDDPSDALLLVRALSRSGRGVAHERVEDAAGLRSALARGPWDVVISDWTMRHICALEALATLADAGLDIPFLIVSGTVGEEAAVEALRAGAHDFMPKERLARLVPAVEREMRERTAREGRRRAERALAESEARYRRIVETTREGVRHAQKMEAIGTLAASVVHEFNNLLSVIMGYVDLALRNLAPGDPLGADLTEIGKAGERAATLTRQLLTLSRPQVAQLEVIDVNLVLMGMEKMLRIILGEDVELRVLTAPDLPKVKADPGQVEQVVLNLVMNARDAMPAGGRLIIETANASLEERHLAPGAGVLAGPQAMIAVSDTGCGMDRATTERMFEPFFTTKEKGKGTGLGLSTVLEIVEQSGGTVRVDSTRRVGTTFRIYLPAFDDTGGERASAVPLPPAQVRGGSETILLVENDEALRGLSRTILREHGYHVLDAPNGGEALLICERHPAHIDLLLTDVVLPRMSGRQLAERMCPLRPGMRTLYMSGYTADAMIRYGVLDPGVAFLHKPLTPEALTRKVREVLDGESREAPRPCRGFSAPP